MRISKGLIVWVMENRPSAFFSNVHNFWKFDHWRLGSSTLARPDRIPDIGRCLEYGHIPNIKNWCLDYGQWKLAIFRTSLIFSVHIPDITVHIPDIIVHVPDIIFFYCQCSGHQCSEYGQFSLGIPYSGYRYLMSGIWPVKLGHIHVTS